MTSFRVPTSSHWLALPTDLDDVQNIKWEEGQPRSANYYTGICYWGTLDTSQIHAAPSAATGQAAASGTVNGQAAPPVAGGAKKTFTPPTERSIKGAGVSVIGSAKIFIAEEFMSAIYRHGPNSKLHIKDLADYDEAKKEPKWITMYLDERFHFGQNGKESSPDSLRRFIVYHPPVATGMSPPRIYQHRFTGTPDTDLASKAAKSLANAVPKELQVARAAGQVASTTIQLGLSAGKSVFGHYLHQYLSDAGVKRAHATVEEWQKDKSKPTNQAGSYEASTLLLAMQHLERQEVVEDNAQAKEEAKRQLRHDLDTAKRLAATESTFSGLWAIFSGKRTRAKVVAMPTLTKEDHDQAEKQLDIIVQDADAGDLDDTFINAGSAAGTVIEKYSTATVQHNGAANGSKEVNQQGVEKSEPAPNKTTAAVQEQTGKSKKPADQTLQPSRNRANSATRTGQEPEKPHEAPNLVDKNLGLNSQSRKARRFNMPAGRKGENDIKVGPIGVENKPVEGVN